MCVNIAPHKFCLILSANVQQCLRTCLLPLLCIYVSFSFFSLILIYYLIHQQLPSSYVIGRAGGISIKVCMCVCVCVLYYLPASVQKTLSLAFHFFLWSVDIAAYVVPVHSFLGVLRLQLVHKQMLQC